MVTIHLKSGETVRVERGEAAMYDYKTIEERTTTPTTIGAVLQVKDERGYGGRVIAAFAAEEVIGYTVEPEEEACSVKASSRLGILSPAGRRDPSNFDLGDEVPRHGPQQPGRGCLSDLDTQIGETGRQVAGQRW